MKKFAVFDIDGTLYRWQLYHELVQVLALANVFPKTSVTELDQAWNAWRGGEKSFEDYEDVVIKLMTKNLPLVPIPTFEAACDKVITQSAHKTYRYTKNLLQKLKNDGYVIIAITGSQQELIDRFGAKYGIAIVVGVQYERADGRFTGKAEVMTVGKKPEILRKIVENHTLDWTESFAIGDSAGDTSILELVENPIAFNPDAGLFERAKREGWPIVIERKNIAYKLEKSNDELVLADTITY